MTRVLVAEDSTTVRRLLVEILESDPELEVVGEASDGVEAVELTARLRPDVVVMDVYMPEMDGLAATKAIMERAPTPIVVISSRVTDQIGLSLAATEAGALHVLAKPTLHDAEPDASQAELVRMVKAMADVKVVRRWGRSRNEAPEPDPPPAWIEQDSSLRVVAIGASTGGPAAVRRILTGLPPEFPTPLLVVQHIARGFAGGFAEWLDGSCDLRVAIARDEEPLQPARVYVAPDDRHLGATRDGRIRLSDAPSLAGFRPSATYLFESVAGAFGREAVAVVLSGMGTDGIEGLRALRSAGGRILAQDQASAVVYGMGGEAVERGLVDEVLGVERIAPRLLEYARRPDV